MAIRLGEHEDVWGGPAISGVNYTIREALLGVPTPHVLMLPISEATR